MTAILAIANVVRVSVDTILALPGYALYAKQNSPRPPGPYAVIDFVADTSIGWEQSTYTAVGPDDVQQNIEGVRTIGFSLSFLKGASKDDSRAVRTGLVRDSIINMFSDANLGLLTRSPVRDIDEPLENGWEDRSIFDITLSAVGTDTDIIYAINSAEVFGGYGSKLRVPEIVPGFVAVGTPAAYELSWGAADRATNYLIAGSHDGVIWFNPVDVGDVLAHSDGAGIAPGNKRYYRILGRNDAGDGPWSATVDATIP